MGAAELVSELLGEGFRLEVAEGDRVAVWPGSRLDPARRARIVEHREGVVRELEQAAAWLRVAKAGVRSAVLVFGADGAGVGTVLDALRETPSALWPELAARFEEQVRRHGGVGDAEVRMGGGTGND